MYTLLLLLACAQEPTSAEEVTQPVVIYSGRGESLIGPLFQKMETETGIDLEVRYGDTSELVTLMLTEGDLSPADIIYAQDTGHLGVLADRDRLQPLEASLLAQVDPRFQDEKGRWIGISGRARVLVYNTQSIQPSELPQSLQELADPKWKGKLGWAPTNSSFQAHVSALRHLWGEEQTRQWLTAVAENQPQRYPKNSPQVEAAANGAISMGWVNHYYLHQKKTDDYPAANHSFPAEGDAGNVLMLAGAGIRSASPRAAEAALVLEWLASEPAQTWFAQENFEYPTRPGISTHPDVVPLSELHLANLEQAWLADLVPTRTMLQDLGIL